MVPQLISNPCLCKSGKDTILYPQKIDWNTFGAYEFSARRERKIQHYRIVKCNTCRLVRSDPVLSREDLKELYKNCKFLYQGESLSSAKTYARLVKKYSGYSRDFPASSILEIGCGNGTFLEEMKSLKIGTLSGVEPSIEAVSNASEEIRANIINDVFKQGFFKAESFDIVCAFHILDHLSDPDEFAKECYRIIKKGGLFILVCHNVDALPNKVLGGLSPVFDIEHIFLFNKKTLAKLSEDSGFSVIEVGNLINTYKVSYWLKYIPLLNKIIKIFPESVRESKLSLQAGNIFICAQKK